MKVNGTGQPPAPDEGTEPTSNAPSQGIQAPAGTSPGAATFADKLAGAHSNVAAPVAEVTRPGDTSVAGGVSVSDLAADLRSGKLTPTAAIDKIVERVMARQLGSDAPPAVRERVKMALQEAIESDPHLTEKLRQL